MFYIICIDFAKLITTKRVISLATLRSRCVGLHFRDGKLTIKTLIVKFLLRSHH